MKNVQEVMEALIRGDKLRNGEWGSYEYIYMKDSKIYSENNEDLFTWWGSDHLGDFIFNFEDVEIYQEPKWYDNIPGYGILCWVWNNTSLERYIRVVDEKDADNLYHTGRSCWLNAIPLTQEEVEQYIYKDNK